jgi:hypothetical protein
MVDVSLLASLFVVGFLLNLVWEFSHSQLYETCRRKPWRKNVPLLIKMSLKDGLFIVLFYVLAVSIFGSRDILTNPSALTSFMLLSLGFAFFDEKTSLRLGRWEYAATMPRVFSVGLTPLLEIALTGLLTFIIVFQVFR